MSNTDDTVLRIGCLGCGDHGVSNNYRRCFDNPRIHIRAMCDFKQDLLDRGAALYRPDYTTTDYRQMLDDPQIDAILVITADAFHAPLSIDCLHGGKHVFVEKPLARTLEECHAIMRAARETQRKVMVGFNRRFAPIYVDLKRMLDQAAVSPELSRQRRPPVLFYRIVDDPRMASSAMLHDPLQGGRLNEEICHIFDLFHHFIGSEPRRVFAGGEQANAGVIQIEYDNGASGLIIEGGLGHAGFMKEYYEVYAHGAQASVDFFQELRFASDDCIQRLFYESAGPPTYRMQVVEQSDVIARTLASRRADAQWCLESGLYRAVNDAEREARWRELVKAGDAAKADRRRQAAPFIDKGHYGEHEAFRQAIVNDQPSPISEIDGARAFVLGQAVAESMRIGRPVQVDQSLYLL